MHKRSQWCPPGKDGFVGPNLGSYSDLRIKKLNFFFWGGVRGWLTQSINGSIKIWPSPLLYPMVPLLLATSPHPCHVPTDHPGCLQSYHAVLSWLPAWTRCIVDWITVGVYSKWWACVYRWLAGYWFLCSGPKGLPTVIKTVVPIKHPYMVDISRWRTFLYPIYCLEPSIRTILLIG